MVVASGPDLHPSDRFEHGVAAHLGPYARRVAEPEEQLDLLAGVPKGTGEDGQPLVSRERWGTFDRHDPVKVAGLRGEHVFWAHVTNPATGDEWITVYGGLKHGVRQFRSVEVAAVRPRRATTRRAPGATAGEAEQATLDL